MNKEILLQSFLLFLVITTVSNSFAQNSLIVNDFQEIYSDSLALSHERLVLHVADNHINKNDAIFFKGYLLLGTKQGRNSLSKVLIIELLNENGNILKTQFHQINNGMVEGFMKLPKNTISGKYFLKGYTRWMRNYVDESYTQEDIFIGVNPLKLNEPEDISQSIIEPEGGTLLSGYVNTLIIRSPSVSQKKINPFGRILDDKKQEIAKVNFYSDNLGTAIFKPKKDKLYQLALPIGTFPIPKAEDQGYLLNVNNLDENTVKIRVTASSGNSKSKVTLFGTSTGTKYLEKELNFNESNILDIKLSKKDFPHGIFILKLVNKNGKEIARRPIWIDAEKLHIDIELISKGPKENVYKVKVTDKNNSPIKAQLALSVTRHDLQTEKALRKDSNNRFSLLTNINNTGMDKFSADRKNRFLQDLNIQISNVDNTLADSASIKFNPKFSIQKGLEFRGYAYDLNNKLLENTTIQIIAQTENEFWLEEVHTDTNGLIRLDKIELTGNIKLIFRTQGSNTKSRLVKVVPLKEWEKNNEALNSNFQIKKTTIAQVKSLKPNSAPQLESVDKNDLIELEEVEISEKLDKKRNTNPSIYGIDVPKNRIKYQDPKRPKSIGQMLSEIPGVIVSGDLNLSPSITIPRASGPILFVLDGYPLPQGNLGQSLGAPIRTSLFEVMSLVSAVDVERIELLIGTDAAIYGSRGSGGVISIYTRTGKEKQFISRKDAQLNFEGYAPLIEFNSYAKNLSKKEKENFNLIYWNPKLETNEYGETTIKIPLQSQNFKTMFKISTITSDGKVGFLEVSL